MAFGFIIQGDNVDLREDGFLTTTFGHLNQSKKYQVNKKWEFGTRARNIFFPLKYETTNSIFADICLSAPETGKVFTDLTELLLFTINWGMNYIQILYAYDANAIFVEPIKSRIDTDILCAYDALYDALETVKHAPKLNIMDNELSTALNRLLQKNKTVVHLALPHIHRLRSSIGWQ